MAETGRNWRVTTPEPSTCLLSRVHSVCLRHTRGWLISYYLFGTGYALLYKTRGALGLLKYRSMAAEPGTRRDAALMATDLTLMDEQLGLVVDDAKISFP